MKSFKKLAEKIAIIQGKLILFLIYFTIAPIFAFIVKISQKENDSIWHPWHPNQDTINDLKKQY